jgi:hypothetical protein
MRISVIAVMVAAGVPATAYAADRTASADILRGNYVQAERVLTTERRIFPARPELMLNLAAVYRNTGRERDAQALYADVLRRPDVLMDMPDQRIVSSHALAQAGLQRAAQLASR